MDLPTYFGISIIIAIEHLMLIPWISVKSNYVMLLAFYGSHTLATIQIGNIICLLFTIPDKEY